MIASVIHTVTALVLLFSIVASESCLNSNDIEDAITNYLKKIDHGSKKSPIIEKNNRTSKLKPLNSSLHENLLKPSSVLNDAPLAVRKATATAEKQSNDVATSHKEIDDPSLEGQVISATSIAKRNIAKGPSKVYNTCGSPKMFAMTFDEGPNFVNTEKILSALKVKGIEATFHICAHFLPGTRDLVKKILKDGHLLGMRFNPLITDLRGLSESHLRMQLKLDRKIIYDNTGIRVKFLRLPFKGYSDRELRIITSQGFVVTEHNLDSYDFQEGKIMSAFKNKLNECKASKCSGIISVQREGSSETAKRLPAIINLIDDVGYNFVKLDKCIKGVD